MARAWTLAAGVLTIAAASGLYALKFDTSRIEAEVQRLEREIEKAEGDIAVLRAERAYLGRPDRIDTLARSHGLRPIAPTQYRSADADLDLAPRASAPASRGGLESLSDAEALAAARAILAPGAGRGKDGP